MAHLAERVTERLQLVRHPDAPRVLVANSNLVPQWATWDHFNELDKKGLMMFAPVGYSGDSVKVSPPLVITEEPLRESLAVCEEAMREVIQ